MLQFDKFGGSVPKSETKVDDSKDIVSIKDTGIRMPTLKNRFILVQWLPLSKAKEELIAIQLINVDISIKKPEYGSKLGFSGVNSVIFVIEDDRDGLVSNIITQDLPRTMHAPLIRFGLTNGGSDIVNYLNLEGVKIIDISYDLDYAASETAKFVITCDFTRMFRTID